MVNFRKKIFLGDVIVLIAFLGVLFPIVHSALDFVVQRTSVYRGEELASFLEKTFVFEIIFVLIIGLMIAFYIFLNQLIVHRFTRPIVLINDAVRSYKEGKEGTLPRIVLPPSHQGDEFGKLVFTLNSMSDRIQVQIEDLIRQREETKDILESIFEGIIATDTSAQITFVNRAACQMLGMAADGTNKQTLEGVKAKHPDLSKKCHEMILHALQTDEATVQTWALRSGNSVFLNLISAPLRHQDGALLVLQDVTSDYKVIEMGKDFIANASHELRTPITIIRGFAETLQDLPKLSQEMVHEIIEKIVRTCGRLDKLVRSLLTLADIENFSQERLTPTNLFPLAENCLHQLLTAYPQTKISLKSKRENVPIAADADLMELAIFNLLENAVKYSQNTPVIEISIEVKREEVELHVKDRGIGISETDLPHIFDRFYTVDKARSRKSGGAGLGLSIVKTIVEKHKGRVVVSSELGKGSVFTLILPLKKG